jgi:hypothetical protein
VRVRVCEEDEEEHRHVDIHLHTHTHIHHTHMLVLTACVPIHGFLLAEGGREKKAGASGCVFLLLLLPLGPLGCVCLENARFRGLFYFLLLLLLLLLLLVVVCVVVGVL